MHIDNNIDYRKELESLNFTCEISFAYKSDNQINFVARGAACICYTMPLWKYEQLKDDKLFINDVWYRLYVEFKLRNNGERGY